MSFSHESNNGGDKLGTVGFALAGAAVFGAAAIGHVANGIVNSALTRLSDDANQSFEESVGKYLSAEAAASFAASHERTQELLVALRALWLPGIDVEPVVIPSADGRYGIAGFIYPSVVPSKRWVLLVHGYRGEHSEMEGYGSYYARRGFNVLAVDLRSHGQSEGYYLGMGGPERFDILLWVDYLIDRFGEGIELVLHGHSLGAATILMAAGEGLQSQVKAIISDCAFSSVWELFSEILVCRRIPPRPLLDAARLIMRVRSGYDIKQVNVAKRVAQNVTPTLYVHGGADIFIPPTMAVDLYSNTAARLRELRIVPGAGHAESFAIDPDAYFALIDDFLAQAGMAAL